MSATDRPVDIGDKFEDLDPRAGERVIEIVGMDSKRGGYRYVVRVYVRMPWMVADPNRRQKGRYISGQTLRKRYQRVSR